MSLFPSSRARSLFFGIFIGFLILGAWLPSATRSVFASPDETAVAIIADTLRKTGRALLPQEQVITIPWLHPRSWVSSGPNLIPVGFLGWPLLLAPFVFLFGRTVLPWMGLLLATSALYPAFRLLARRFSLSQALIGTLLLGVFPTVVLYANRGLFANLPQLALLAWWLFLVRSEAHKNSFGRRAFLHHALVGALGISLLLLRPVEAIWLLPWMWWWSRKRTWSRSDILACFGGAVPIILLSVYITYRTYGDPFAIGYLLRDNPLPPLQGMGVSVATPVSSPSSVEWSALLPYGFHPRHIWWNLQSFTLEILWPWLLGLVVVWVPIVVRTVRRLREGGVEGIKSWRVTSLFSTPVLLSVWTIIFLLTLYGSGLYADHIRPGAVTIGNSFLRYMLPLVLLWVWLFLCALEKNQDQRGVRRYSWVIAFVLLVTSLWTVFAKDDEGLLATRRELKRYAMIRAAAEVQLPPGTIVLSERSDKIFFPVFPVVSPLPPPAERLRLAQVPGVSLALFARPLSQSERDAWRVAGVVPQELQSFGRERLYYLQPMGR